MTEAEIHGDDRLVKPFILDQHRLMVGDLVIDLPMRTITSRSQKLVKLTGNEFAVLATMTKFAGSYVSRKELMRSVAGDDFDGEDALVDIYISYLRRRLTEAETSVTIEKQTGVGFRICP